MLIRFSSRAKANDYAQSLFDTHALNIKKPSAKELFSTRLNAESDFSVWNPQGIFNPHLPGYDCTELYTGSDKYRHDFPIDRMRDWNNEDQVSGGGYFWLSLIHASDFCANIYLADDGFEPVQQYLEDSILRVIRNYDQIAYISESMAAATLLGQTNPAHTSQKPREAPYDFTKQESNKVELDAELDAYFRD